MSETVVHLTHYIGWPLATGVNEAALRVLDRRRQAGQGQAEQPPADQGA